MMVIAVLPFASTHAADLGARVQPPVVAAAYNWSGFYAGLTILPRREPALEHRARGSQL